MFGITSGKKGGGFWPPSFSSDAKINHSYLTTKHLATIYSICPAERTIFQESELLPYIQNSMTSLKNSTNTKFVHKNKAKKLPQKETASLLYLNILNRILVILRLEFLLV